MQNRDEENQRSRYYDRQEPCATYPENAVLQDLASSDTSQRSERYSHSPENQASDHHHAHDGLGMCAKRLLVLERFDGIGLHGAAGREVDRHQRDRHQQER